VKVSRRQEAECARWTGHNNIEFINWLKASGLDWQYDSANNEFWLSDWDDSEYTVKVCMGNYVVTYFHGELDRHVIVVYSSLTRLERDGWSCNE